MKLNTALSRKKLQLTMTVNVMLKKTFTNQMYKQFQFLKIQSNKTNNLKNYAYINIISKENIKYSFNKLNNKFTQFNCD